MRTTVPLLKPCGMQKGCWRLLRFGCLHLYLLWTLEYLAASMSMGGGIGRRKSEHRRAAFFP